jgi:putative salt-induced outer membrane protein YdiY
VLRKADIITVIAFLGLTSSAFADQITLKNGDRLSGTIVKSDGKTLLLHTEFAGDVTIDFKAVTQITSEKDLRVGTSDKKTLVGPVTTSDGKVEVATKAQGTVDVPLASVAGIGSEADYEKSVHPGLLRGWNGGVNVGFSLARGNSETTNLALGINAVHPTLNDKTIIYLSSIDTQNELATPSTVADLITAGIRYDHNLNPKLFAYVAADFMSNALQDLDLRGMYGGGLGFHAIASDRSVLDFFAGLNYTHETYSNGPAITPVTVPPTYSSYGVTNRFLALTLGEQLVQKAGKTTVVTEKFDFYPNLSDTGEYQWDFNLGTVTKIAKWLGWQNQFSDIYVSNPPVDKKKNDLILTTGINFSFTH